jgi:hypothetical protein
MMMMMTFQLNIYSKKEKELDSVQTKLIASILPVVDFLLLSLLKVLSQSKGTNSAITTKLLDQKRPDNTDSS